LGFPARIVTKGASMERAHILVVDDSLRLREVLRLVLQREGFAVTTAAGGQEALELCRRSPPDLVVLDVLMPDPDGFSVCRALRRESRVPVIFLSSRGETVDRVTGLELGADDYLAKPFANAELISRVRAVLRRSRPETALEEPEAGAIELGDLRVDPARHRCGVGGAEVVLTVTEMRLLCTLMTSPGRVYNRDELVARAYEGEHHVAPRTVDSHLRNLRRKLAAAGLEPIETVVGLGYRIEAARARLCGEPPCAP
jgi:two-component system OmpR family response regulator